MPENTQGVEEIVARCLTDPAFLERARQDAHSALAPYRPTPELAAYFAGGGLERIRRFSGFIGKIQHNHLWDHFPATRALLRHYGIEMTTFADFRPLQLAGRASGRSRDQQLNDFLSFVELDVDQGRYPGIACVTRWERALWRMQIDEAAPAVRSAISATALRALPSSQFLRLRIDANAVGLADFDCDPMATTTAALGDHFEHRCDGETRHFMFLKDAAAVRTFEIDAYSALILSQARSGRSLRTVLRRSRKIAGLLSSSTGRAFLETAVERGWLRIATETG